MDMYQKRKMRAEKKSKQDDSKVLPSVSINCSRTKILGEARKAL